MFETVAIETPSDAAAAETEGVLSGCRVALGEAHCVLAADGSSGASYLATVGRGEERELVVVLRKAGEPRSEGPPLGERRLHFESADPAAYRYQTAGVVVASMVLGLDDGGPKQEPLPPPRPPVPPQTRVTPEEKVGPAPSTYSVRADVAALGGPGLSGGDARFGGLVRATLALRFPLLVVGDLRLAGSDDAVSDGSVSSLWFTGGLGVGSSLSSASGSLALEMTARCTLESFGVRAKDSFGSESTSRPRWGGRLGLLGVARLHRYVGVVVGADANLAWPSFDVEVAGGHAQRLGVFTWTGHAGLRFWLFPGETGF